MKQCKEKERSSIESPRQGNSNSIVHKTPSPQKNQRKSTNLDVIPENEQVAKKIQRTDTLTEAVESAVSAMKSKLSKKKSRSDASEGQSQALQAAVKRLSSKKSIMDVRTMPMQMSPQDFNNMLNDNAAWQMMQTQFKDFQQSQSERCDKIQDSL